MQRTFKQVLLNPHAYEKNIASLFLSQHDLILWLCHASVFVQRSTSCRFRGFMVTRTKVLYLFLDQKKNVIGRIHRLVF